MPSFYLSVFLVSIPIITTMRTYSFIYFLFFLGIIQRDLTELQVIVNILFERHVFLYNQYYYIIFVEGLCTIGINRDISLGNLVSIKNK